MDTPQDKIREFFWELDKVMGPNHPFIVLHGPAYTFREYLERNIEDTAEGIEVRRDNWRLEQDVDRLRDDIGALESGIEDAIRLLKQIKPDEDLTEEVDAALEEVIDDLESLI